MISDRQSCMVVMSWIHENGFHQFKSAPIQELELKDFEQKELELKDFEQYQELRKIN